MDLIRDQKIVENFHEWTVLNINLQTFNENDLIEELAKDVLDAYGYEEFIKKIEYVDSKSDSTFDLDAISKAFLKTLPNPVVEYSKPKQLRNYRSETTEIVSRKIMQKEYKIIFPVSSQKDKLNTNQPILGYDGWGLICEDEEHINLALLIVKGSEENASPPKVVTNLANECNSARIEEDKLLRVLINLCFKLDDQPILEILVRLIQNIYNNIPQSIYIAPILIRGLFKASISDLNPVRNVFLPEENKFFARGIAASLGIELTELGEKVMLKVRNS